MNFFKEQELVLKRIKRFRILFYLVVLATAFTTAFFVSSLQNSYNNHHSSYSRRPRVDVFIPALIGTIVFIIMMTLLRRYQLKSGGAKVAEMAGGVLIPSNPGAPDFKKLRNIVEEMSIASGIVTPKIYLLPLETHINAFAAGNSIKDAVIGISQGCLDKLNRDELQGVVAHEIGHIISGDMKLNLELLSFLFGLMGISQIGQTLMRRRVRGRDGSSMMVLGFGFFIIGSFGHLMGQLLKLAISRGQEFGADAKAVQFTRNPQGIGGALIKILTVEKRFAIQAQNASEISHFYFHFPSGFSNFFDTHPPTVERIKKVLPHFEVRDFNRNERKSIRTLMESAEKNVFIKSFGMMPELPESGRDCRITARALFYNVSSCPKEPENSEVREELERLKRLTSDEKFDEIEINIGRLKNLNESEKTDILEELKKIIFDDKRIFPREILMFALYQEFIGQDKTKSPALKNAHHLKNEIRTVLAFLAFISSMSETSRLNSFQLGMQKIFPTLDPGLPPKLNVSMLMRSLTLLRSLKPMDKQLFLRTCEEVVLLDMMVDFDESIFLMLLKQILDVPSK